MRWLIQPFNLESRDEERVAFMQWLMGFPIFEVLHRKRGLLFGIKGNNDKLEAAVCLFEYDAKKDGRGGPFEAMASWFWDMRAFMAIKSEGASTPEIMTKKEYKAARKEFMLRGNALKKLIRKTHSQYGPKGRHWYVELVGVHPDAQGRGYGGQVMRALSRVADEVGMACYLECSGNNRAFYEKFGYKVMGKEKITSCHKGDDGILGFFMLREPLSDDVAG